MSTCNRTAVGRHGSRIILWTALLLPVFAACSSAVAPPASVSVLVTNATCIPGPCQAIRILGFPQDQPRTPGGLWSIDLGIISAASACLTIPSEASFRVIDASSGKADTVTWTNRDSVALGSLAPAESRFQPGPTTEYFVPQHERGWSVALPGSSRPGPAGACIP